MTTLTIKRRKKAKPEQGPEPVLLSPETIHAEIERLMARPVGFALEPYRDEDRQMDFYDLRFVCDGLWIHSRVTDADRALSLDEFSQRVVGPQVAIWRMQRARA